MLGGMRDLGAIREELKTSVGELKETMGELKVTMITDLKSREEQIKVQKETNGLLKELIDVMKKQ